MSLENSSSLSSMNCADLYTSFSFPFLSRIFFFGSSSSSSPPPPPSLPLAELGLPSRRSRRRRRVFLPRSCAARFPPRSSGACWNCAITARVRARSESRIPAGMYHSSGRASVRGRGGPAGVGSAYEEIGGRRRPACVRNACTHAGAGGASPLSEEKKRDRAIGNTYLHRRCRNWPDGTSVSAAGSSSLRLLAHR